jgi:transketolase
MAGGPQGKRIGLTDVPACGQNDEVLRHHGLDAEGIARTVRETV